jgi:hypothetical protein
VTTRWRAWSIEVAVGAIAITAIPARVSADVATPPTLQAAQMMFYNGRYAEAAAATRELCTADVITLPACEVRTSALLFQLRRAIGESPDKNQAFTQCEECPALLAIFVAETRRAQGIVRAYLKAHPGDEETLFLLGKLDLNYVWLQLGTLGRKTGWDEYWEARRSLDQVLKVSPGHVRAKIARAWIDYIVDTKMPRGTRWLLGGGSKKRGLQAVREAATTDGDFFVRAEAGFALWDMQVRERNITGAVETARRLAADFPDNLDIRKFLKAHNETETSEFDLFPAQTFAVNRACVGLPISSAVRM